jgi:hypothetical protein
MSLCAQIKAMQELCNDVSLQQKNSGWLVHGDTMEVALLA